MGDEYSHRFHAGNVGDVWKHCVLAALIAGLRVAGRPLHVIETHAGAGVYDLGPTGEWTEGIGKVWRAAPGEPRAVERYLETLRRAGGGLEPRRVYPGSPLLTLALLGEGDSAEFCELDDDAHAGLVRALARDARATVHRGDGMALLPALMQRPGDLLLHVDPPWTAKSEWTAIPDALLSAWQAHPQACLMLWYPIKSYTRVNAMLQRLGRAGLPAVILELITTPLEWQRNRLNGSGVLLVNAPESVLVEAAAAAPVLGRLCATHDGRWTGRQSGWIRVE
jgi:23S rRNA (adenine2030-N6)-methyltransferase